MYTTKAGSSSSDAYVTGPAEPEKKTVNTPLPPVKKPESLAQNAQAARARDNSNRFVVAKSLPRIGTSSLTSRDSTDQITEEPRKPNSSPADTSRPESLAKLPVRQETKKSSPGRYGCSFNISPSFSRLVQSGLPSVPAVRGKDLDKDLKPLCAALVINRDAELNEADRTAIERDIRAELLKGLQDLKDAVDGKVELAKEDVLSQRTNQTVKYQTPEFSF
jgi:hypothetical protein